MQSRMSFVVLGHHMHDAEVRCPHISRLLSLYLERIVTGDCDTSISKWNGKKLC